MQSSAVSQRDRRERVLDVRSGRRPDARRRQSRARLQPADQPFSDRSGSRRHRVRSADRRRMAQSFPALDALCRAANRALARTSLHRLLIQRSRAWSASVPAILHQRITVCRDTPASRAASACVISPPAISSRVRSRVVVSFRRFAMSDICHFTSDTCHSESSFVKVYHAQTDLSTPPNRKQNQLLSTIFQRSAVTG